MRKQDIYIVLTLFISVALTMPLGAFAQCGAYTANGNEIPCGDPNFSCCEVPGACNGPGTACNNYDPDYASTGGCDMSCVSPGCTDTDACNYNPAATSDDGSCEYFSCAVLGCTNPSACNFNPEADFEDGSCELPNAGLDCNGNCLADADDDGVCDANEVAGCTDASACDYNPNATDDAGCTSYPDAGYDCDGNCIQDTNSNDICDVEETTGCVDATACNYDATATLDDGICEYLSCAVYGCTDATACNYDASATQDDGSCEGPPTGLNCDGSCVNDSDSDGVCDGNEVAGCMDEDALNFNEEATDSDDSCVYPEPPPAAFAFTPTAASGLFLGQVTLDGVAAIGNDWIAALDASGVVAGAAQILVNEGTAYAQLVIYGDDATTTEDEGMSGSEAFTLSLYDSSTDSYYDYYSATGQTEFNGWVNTNGAPMPAYGNPAVVYAFSTSDYVPDCLDPTACNFDPTSLSSFNCAYAAAGYTCDGICLDDDDEDGVCNGNEVAGCQDSQACNYNPNATDAATCTYPENGYDCAGVCLVDTDGDGTCDAIELDGCTDAAACNYNSDATEEDGTCTYPDFGLNCEGGCAADADNDGVCDAFEVLGCDDEGACNYEAGVTENDGSCTYADAGYDCSGACLADADGDGVCDPFEVVGCTDSSACNYNPLVTDEDGSCAELDEVGECGGDCTADADGDGLCDDVDPCVGAYDACGICNGPGAIYTCGCTGIPEGDCDCDGNQLDALGVCGGDCLADLDNDGVCDDEDPCVGALDECGVCNGPGAVYACGCDPVPAGDCDCEGNTVDAVGTCGGTCESDTDGDGVCDTDEVLGCTIPFACNYDADATEEDGTCTYAASGLGCDGNCLNDADGDGICDGDEVAGCDDENALNFNPTATDDDGSCLYPVPPPPSFVVTGTPASGTMFGQATLDGAPADAYDWVGAFDGDGNCAGASQIIVNNDVAYINLSIYGDDATTADLDEGITGDEPFYLLLWDESAQTIIYWNGGGPDGAIVGWTNTNGAPIPGLNNPSVVYDFSTDDYEPNCNDPQACNFDASATVNVGCLYAEFGYDCNGNCLADADGDGVCNPFEVTGCTNPNACNYNSAATEESGSCTYPDFGYACDGTCLEDMDSDGICDASEIPGCTDLTACNYNSTATDNDGSCTYEDSVYNCDGECIEDTDSDGICDALEIPGCDDAAACNYNAAATDNNGSCIYPSQPFLDCTGNCINDQDGDGLCDEQEGCLDEAACNYNPSALEEDGSCTYPEDGLDCAGDCLNDADQDGVCDANEISGCTYTEACNYSADATDDDGSCAFVPIGYDCDMNCLYDADGDGVCDADEVAGCTDPDAMNYSTAATDDDGSCIDPACPSDLDGDGYINIGDVLVLLADYGQPCE